MSLYATHNKLTVKITRINNLFEYIQKRKILRSKNVEKFEQIVSDFKELEDEYMLKMAIFLTEQSSDYENYISRTNIDVKFTQYVESVKTLLGKNDKEIAEKVLMRLNNKLSRCDKNVLDVKSSKIPYYICVKCKVPKEIFPNLSEMRCSECAEIEKMEGTDFEEHSIQDPNKQKKGDYDPTRFVDIWIDRTLAIREVNFTDKKTGKPEALIAVGEEAKKSNIKNKNEITCEYIRQVWKLRGFTSYNDDAAYARFILTGIRPHQPSFKDKRFIKMMVIRIMRIFNQIKDASRSNSLYYAFVIYKVIKQFYNDKPEISLLESIHIQKDETLAYNDLEYEKICEKHNIQYKSPKLIYEPTVSERMCN
jgi:hypothetical protein